MKRVLRRSPSGPTCRACAALLLAIALLAMGPAAAAAACPQTSLPEIEDEVMCPICGVPLVNANGPQAQNERDFIRERVERCQSKSQIKAALVDEYGEQILAMPRRSGFDLAAYLVPVGGLFAALAALIFGAIRWRRAGVDEGPPSGDRDQALARGESLPPDADLDADLRRYDL